MRIVTVSEFRNHAKDYFDSVEKGETIQVYRNGKPVAVVAPFGFQGRVSLPGPTAARAHWGKVRRQPVIHAPGLVEDLLEERRRARF